MHVTLLLIKCVHITTKRNLQAPAGSGAFNTLMPGFGFHQYLFQFCQVENYTGRASTGNKLNSQVRIQWFPCISLLTVYCTLMNGARNVNKFLMAGSLIPVAGFTITEIVICLIIVLFYYSLIACCYNCSTSCRRRNCSPFAYFVVQ